MSSSTYEIKLQSDINVNPSKNKKISSDFVKTIIYNIYTNEPPHLINVFTNKLK